MKIAKWIALGISVLSGVIYLVGYYFPINIGGLSLRESSAIGIIGGADGPTAIFVRKGPTLGLALPAIFVVSLLAWLFFHWKSKN